MKKLVCDKCNKEIVVPNFNRHYIKCNGTIKNKFKIEKCLDIEKINEDLYKCKICNKEYKKKGIGFHYWKKHTGEGINCDINRGYKNGTRITWNKGLKYDVNYQHKSKTNNKIECNFCKKIIYNYGSLISHEIYCKLNPNSKERKIRG